MKKTIAGCVGAVTLAASTLGQAFDHEDAEALVESGQSFIVSSYSNTCELVHCPELLQLSDVSQFSVSASDELEDVAEDAENILAWLNEQVKALWAWITDELLSLLRDLLNK